MSEKITAHEKSYLRAVVKIISLEQENAVLREALQRISRGNVAEREAREVYSFWATEALEKARVLREGK